MSLLKNSSHFEWSEKSRYEMPYFTLRNVRRSFARSLDKLEMTKCELIFNRLFNPTFQIKENFLYSKDYGKRRRFLGPMSIGPRNDGVEVIMANRNFWKNKKVLITGVSFIGSHLVDRLVEMGAAVRVVNITSKHASLIGEHIKKKRVEFKVRDLRDLREVQRSVAGTDIVFHLACDHGGRGYVDLHQGATSGNFLLDGAVFWAALKEGVEKVVFASSGCVYPNFLQTDPKKTIYLKEEMVKPPYDADNMYGWGKLMGELTLKNYYQDFGLKSVSLRYFTVYGERGVENHAVIAMIARAFIGQNPYEVWGTGEQIRNWTYVGDIVEGTLLAAEKIDDGRAINLGTMERTKVIEAVREVLRYTGHKARIVTRPKMPTGPYNRVADNSLAKELLGWNPKVKFVDGLHRTIDWYFKTKNKKEIMKNFKTLLTEK